MTDIIGNYTETDIRDLKHHYFIRCNPDNDKVNATKSYTTYEEAVLAAEKLAAWQPSSKFVIYKSVSTIQTKLDISIVAIKENTND